MAFEDILPSANLVIGGVIAGLTVAALTAYAKRRRLYVIVPRLFSFSDLSSGQIIELTILNRGTQTEESIEVQLSPKLTYTIIATTLPSINIGSDATLRIARLSKGEEVSVVISTEGGEFNQESVLSISSKLTTGEIKKKLEESQEPTPAAITSALALIFIFMPVMGYFIGNIVVNDIWPRIYPEITEISSAQKALEDEGWEDVDKLLSVLTNNEGGSDWPVSIGAPKRSGELLAFPIKFTNSFSERMSARVSVATAYVPHEYLSKHGHYPKSIETGILILPGRFTSRSLEAYIPFTAEYNLAIFDFGIEAGGNNYSFKYEWVFEADM